MGLEAFLEGDEELLGVLGEFGALCDELELVVEIHGGKYEKIEILEKYKWKDGG